MKLSKMFLSLFLASTIGCQIVSMEDDSTNSQSDIIGPQTIPSDLEEYGRFLHNNSQKTFTAISFKLASIDGLQNCRLDDHMIMFADGRYNYDGGQVLCGAEDSQKLRSGTWEMGQNGHTLIFDRGTVREYTVKVDGLDETEIALRGDYLGLQIVGVYKTVE